MYIYHFVYRICVCDTSTYKYIYIHIICHLLVLLTSPDFSKIKKEAKTKILPKARNFICSILLRM